MAVAPLARAAMAAPVVSDDSIPLPEEVEHLGVPVIGAQWPAVMEHDGLRLLGAPVLEEDRDSVLRCDGVHRVLLRALSGQELHHTFIASRSTSTSPARRSRAPRELARSCDLVSTLVPADATPPAQFADGVKPYIRAATPRSAPGTTVLEMRGRTEMLRSSS